MPITPPDAQQALHSLTHAVQSHFGPATQVPSTKMPLIIGIHTGGCWVARHLAAALALEDSHLGQLDVGFYRDDFAHRGMRKTPLPTRLPRDITNQQVLLVDDVLHTGRTIRAAINALFEFGRPRRIWLAVLADRGGRQLPIQAEFAGITVTLPVDQMLRLTGPDPLTLAVIPIGVTA